MKRIFRDENRDELALAIASFLTLFGILAGHTILETARDALFVTRVPPTRLPFVYIAIAIIGVVISRFATTEHKERRSYGITLSLLGAAVVDFGFWIFLEHRGGFIVYAFYVWTGLFASWVITTFWIVLAQAVTITQAKRMYAPIGSGALFGAVVGSATARMVVQTPGLRKLILIAAALSIVTALGPALLFARAVKRTQTAPVPRRNERTAAVVRATFQSKYIPRVLGMVLLATMIATFADYLLKTEVATHIERLRIGSFFASISFWMNSAALILQLFFLDRIIRAAGVHRALAIIPIAFLVLALGGILAPSLIIIVVIKLTDGTLRTSLMKQSTELLLFPVDEELRPRAKVVVDLFGQRFGQALGSIAILILAATHASARELIVGVGIFALLWLVLLPQIRKGYLSLFRRTLAAGELQLDQELPPPDLDSIEAIISALNSAKEGEVVAALDLLEGQGKTDLIPALILFHSSSRVVIRALDILDAAGRPDILPILERLVGSAEPKVRAGALRVLASHDTPNRVLEKYLKDPDLRVRATAVISLARRGAMDDQKLAAVAVDENQDQRHALQTALLRAIRHQPDPRFVPLALRLARTDDRGVMLEAARAMVALNDPICIPELVLLLGYGDPREPARHALIHMGDAALKVLAQTLNDEATPYPIRKQIPRTLAGFNSAAAATALVARLPKESDFTIVRSILRALLQIQKANPKIASDPKLYEKLLADRITAIRRYRGWHGAVLADAKQNASHGTPANDLLSALLHEKEVMLEAHVFGLLGLLDVREDYEAIFRGLMNTNKKARSTSRELLENVLPASVRTEVLAVVDDVHPTETPPIADTLRSLLDQASLTLASLAAYHAKEMGLDGFDSPRGSLRETGEPRGA
ncbi:MAG: HEAT repeat domain-containing protein [Polyangiaceae bacterium]